MRSGNGMSEYNRCRLPRLTINQEDWQPKKKDDTPESLSRDTASVETWESTTFNNELGEAAAVWRLGPGSKKAEKRKKKDDKLKEKRELEGKQRG